MESGDGDLPTRVPSKGHRIPDRQVVSHPGDNFDTMMNYSKDEPPVEVEAFTAAERALSDAGIGFTVVEGPTRQTTEPPLAA